MHVQWPSLRGVKPLVLASDVSRPDDMACWVSAGSALAVCRLLRTEGRGSVRRAAAWQRAGYLRRSRPCQIDGVYVPRPRVANEPVTMGPSARKVSNGHKAIDNLGHLPVLTIPPPIPMISLRWPVTWSRAGGRRRERRNLLRPAELHGREAGRSCT